MRISPFERHNRSGLYQTVARHQEQPPFCKLLKRAPLAQLDRASGYEPEGREFESLRARHFLQQLADARATAVLPDCP